MRTVKTTLLAILLFATTALAQDEKKVTLSLGGGISFPSQPSLFSNYWKMGFNFGAGIGYPLSPSVSLVSSFDYSNFAFNDEDFLRDNGFGGYGITISGGSATIISILGNIKASLAQAPGSVAPYLLGGLGLFSISTSDLTVSAGGLSLSVNSESESAFSILFGAGIDIPAGETTTVFLQAAYSVGFTKNESTNYVPVKAGVAFQL
jgi:opacity protein-like surface antigen